MASKLLEQDLGRSPSVMEEFGSSANANHGICGVAEYGITVRWDKNYLTLIRLL
jgi:hypothetical protein